MQKDPKSSPIETRSGARKMRKRRMGAKNTSLQLIRLTAFVSLIQLRQCVP